MAGQNDQRELQRLRAENARLIALLESHGIDWRPGTSTDVIATSSLTTHEKVALFRRLFQGRTDAYPVRWESKAGKSGYTPACANEWKAGVCEKPRIKCSDCTRRQLIPVTDQTIYDHLAGHHTIGIYPLMEDDSCHFLAVDFDKADWRNDARAFAQSCRELGVPVALEISRSGNGAHAWIFFSSRVNAREARQLGTALISHTCSRTRQLELTSYDRLFPNQDTLPKGGFGNLIALPLQKLPRERGGSIFVDDSLLPHPDQWAFLASIQRMAAPDIEAVILKATSGSHPLDINFVTEEDLAEPWKRSAPKTQRLTGPIPESLSVTLANLLYFEKRQLPQSLTNRLIRLAAFQNPEFHQAQAMRLPVWNKPRLIGCAENYPHHIALPRGCLDSARTLLEDNGIRCDLNDERFTGQTVDVEFAGKLRDDQEEAVSAMLHHDTGILCAPTAFGKTVVAAASIARRGVNTLILVHRTELLRQWKERLETFLQGDKGTIGVVGGGKARPTGLIDIAVMQSVSRKGEINSIVENYGQVIVDECHHVSAFSFEAILKRVRARYILGLTATPVRRDGRQPILFMQCGPIRHTATRPAGAPRILEVSPRYIASRVQLDEDTAIQSLFRELAVDGARTALIAEEIEQNFTAGRKVLVLTERTEHLQALRSALEDRVDRLFTLHGRLHREHAGKDSVRIIDFVDTGHPALARMWERRQRGYLAMDYRMVATTERGTLDMNLSG